MKKERFEVYVPLHLRELRFVVEKELKRQNSRTHKVLQKVAKIVKK